MTISSRLRSMTSLDRIRSALQSAWLPLALLILALSTVFVFGGDRNYLYRPEGSHNWISSQHLTIAVNLSPEHGFQMFDRRVMNSDGSIHYKPYNRFPIGGYASIKLATLPVFGNPSAQIYAARVLMLLFFAGAAILAYFSLCRLTANRWIAVTAILLSFSSYYLLYYNDMIANDGMPDFFGVMLTFHGMVVFVQEGRFRQLIVKICVALLLGWHVYALLAPFVIFGLASELLRARSTADDSSASNLRTTVKHATAVLLRSRYLLFGITALAFGLAILAFNFAMEYAALNGDTPLTELPSFKSMLKRTGVDSMGDTDLIPARYWRPFLEGQLRSIVRMFVPYSLFGPLVYRVDAAGGARIQSPIWLSEFQSVVFGVVLSAACLIGLIFVRHRLLLATLASFGFFWAVPMRNSNAVHDFESIYYIGLPLVFFTIVLLLVRRLTNRDAVIAAVSVAALLLFTVSSFQMSRTVYSAEATQSARAAQHDLLAIRELTDREPVTVLGLNGIRKLLFQEAGRAENYYLNLIFVADQYPPPAGRRFIVTRHRVDSDALLTPQNQHLFLYDWPGLTAGLIASYRSAYPSLASTEPLARRDFDVYIKDNTVYYLKEPCQHDDTKVTFFLHVLPANLDDLPYHRREHGFVNLDFLFTERGVMFDDKCMAGIDLPQYDIAGFRTGSYDDGQKWNVSHVIQGPKTISEYQSIVSNEPDARSEFDLYIDGGNLYYVKEPCGEGDTAAAFFLHIIPADLDDLPGDRRQHGFDNLDFGFDVRGVVFDGKCVAAVHLPQYGIAQITTGQFDGSERVWEVELTPETKE